MIVGKVTAKSQITVPKAVRQALGIRAGDELVWEIEGDHVVLAKARAEDGFVNNFAMFTEWASAADCEAFDNL